MSASSAADHSVLTPDLCVIGAGSAGLSVAAGAAAFGVSTVLIERGKMGGECLNVGCVPSKALLAAADHAASSRRAPLFGVHPGELRVIHAEVHAHIHDTIAAIAPHDSVERFTALGVHVIQAQARFVDARTVEAGGARIRARRFVIATGSRPAVPPIPGLAYVPFLTNDTIFDVKTGFHHLLVIGAGPIGLELAQAHRRLGAEVTVVTSGRALSREDPELAAIVADALRAEGVRLIEHARIEKVESEGGITRLVVQAGTERLQLEGSDLLVATGRTPIVDELSLDKAGVRFGPAGIETSTALQTTNRRIYAIGDCVKNSPRLTHAANEHAGLVLRAILFRLPVRFRADKMPRATYTAPELAQVGLTEAQAREQGLAPRILRVPLAENDRARAERRTEGMIKLVTGPRGRILGAGIAGPQAGELIHIWSLALAKNMRVSDIARYVAPYPTLGEIGKRAAVLYFANAARNPWVRGLLRFLRFWG